MENNKFIKTADKIKSSLSYYFLRIIVLFVIFFVYLYLIRFDSDFEYYVLRPILKGNINSWMFRVYITGLIIPGILEIFYIRHIKKLRIILIPLLSLFSLLFLIVVGTPGGSEMNGLAVVAIFELTILIHFIFIFILLSYDYIFNFLKNNISKLSIFIISILVFPLFFVLAYSPYYTHPDLTEEIAKLWNLKNDNQSLIISQKEIDWMRKGSIDEDKPARWINHFYDPVHEVGWSGKHFGDKTQEEGLYEGESMSPMPAIASIDWVTNQEYQSAYGRQYGNQTWQKAVDAYVKGDKKTAFVALGHILHLIEDASVPDHTRDDTHADVFGDPGSPYEKYAQEYTNSNQGKLNIVEDLKGKDFLNFLTIQSAFEYLANYSNNNFFSEDTINNDEFKNPDLNNVNLEIVSQGMGNKVIRKYLFYDGIYLSLIKSEDILTGRKEYSLDDTSLVLPSYFSHLAPQAVLTGASILDLFFKEAEKYKNNPELLPEIISDSNEVISLYIKKSPRLIAVNSKDVYDKTTIDSKIYLTKSKNIINNVVADIKNLFHGTTVAQTSAVLDSIDASVVPKVDSVTAPAPVASQFTSSPTSAQFATQESTSSQASATTKPDTTSANLTSLQTQLDNAQAMINALQNQASSLNNSSGKVAVAESASQNITKDQYPIAQLTSIPSPGFGGGAPPPASPDSQSTTGADISSAQSQSEVEADNSSSQSQEASQSKDADADNQATSTEEALIIDIDTEAPDITLSILECEDSLSSSDCLTLSLTLNIHWSSSASDLDYFTTNTNGSFATTTATSTMVAILENSIFSFSVSARDEVGNISATSTKTISTFNSPVVINEVAWAGTQAKATDKWIELYNNTDHDIPLDNWILEAEDGAPYIPLSGIIKAKDYYLIERRDDETISDIPADLVVPFSGAGNSSGLSNGGEVLMLSYKKEGNATTTVDKTVVENNRRVWIGGSTSQYQTMERIDSLVSGEDGLNWGTNNLIIINGKDADGWSISGTPKLRNSISSLIARGQPYVTEDIVLTKEKSPYFVNNQWQIFQNGSSLTIEPGVVIKFYGSAGFKFQNSSIIADGTSEEPIIFTSFNDDEYGGDTNNDATSTSPSSGSWYGVMIESDDSGKSVFDNTIFRYAGAPFYQQYSPRANLKIDGASPSVTNSIFGESYLSGLWISNSDSVISDSIFRNNNRGHDSSGINSGVVIGGGSPVFKDNIIEHNERGLYVTGNDIVIDSNIFDSNTKEAVYVSDTIPKFTNNSASGNSVNGIIISTHIADHGSTTILKGDNIPYVANINDIDLFEDSILVIEKGTVVKSKDVAFRINGKLIIEGEKPDDIIFTSLYDDTILPGTVSEGTTTPALFSILKDGSMDARGFTVRYAGDNVYGNGESGVSIEESSAYISDALFSNNYPFGLLAKQSENLVIENSVFRDNNYDGKWGTQGAMALYNSSSTLTNILFENNGVGIMSDPVSTFTTSLIEFIGNTTNTNLESLEALF